MKMLAACFATIFSSVCMAASVDIDSQRSEEITDRWDEMNKCFANAGKILDDQISTASDIAKVALSDCKIDVLMYRKYETLPKECFGMTLKERYKVDKCDVDITADYKPDERDMTQAIKVILRYRVMKRQHQLRQNRSN